MDTPKYLYRFFSKKEYRNQFIQGLIRFGRLEVYKEIEDEERKDIDEGSPCQVPLLGRHYSLTNCA